MNVESGATSPVPDLRPVLSRAFDQAESLIASVTPDQLTRPTPCAEWDVRALLSHFVLVARRIALLGQGRSVFEVPREMIPDAEVRDRFRAGREAADRAWADDAALSRLVEVPWGRVPGRAALTGYVPEVAAHTWDLWSGIDSSLELDPAIAEAALAVARRAIPAARDGFPFGPVVEVPEDADPYTRLVGWMGRSPDWRSVPAAE